MKRQILAAVAIVALASCAKENSAIEPTNGQVAATFASASISRVANNEWETNDKIGITMVDNTTTTPVGIDGTSNTYLNIPYTVGAAGATGTFTADATTIYFPVSVSSLVDFYAYYPYGTIDDDNNLAVDVSSQVFKDIDIVAAKVTGKSKSAPTVTFSGDDAFKHQLSKLTLTINQGDGVASLDGLTTTIKNQPNTAKYNIYSNAISSKGDANDMVTKTTTYNAAKSIAYTSAILIPTEKMSGSTIVFKTATDNNEYTWNTSNIEFEQGNEHKYEITLTRTGVEVNGATIGEWGSGIGGNVNAGDSGTPVASAAAVKTLSATSASNTEITVNWTYPSDVASIAGVRIYYAANSTPDLATVTPVEIAGNTTTTTTLSPLSADTEYYIILATYNSAGDETYYATEVSATTANN